MILIPRISKQVSRNWCSKTLLSATRVSRRNYSLSSVSVWHRVSPWIHDSIFSRKMSTNFGSTAYASAFLDLPVPDTKALRSGALEYLKSFDPNLWYEEPIASILDGSKLPGEGTLIETKDALGKLNGKQYLATPQQVEILRKHIQTYKSPYTDLRPQMRRIEERLLTEYSGFLIGNQCVDFQKQDGVTEMEEATQANAVERRLNDMLLQDEQDGRLSISRKTIFVSCVSNFTNFLDLFRKTLRSLEVGIPCVILGRSNTVQHSYRWTELLVDLMRAEGIDLNMVSYLSCSLDDIKDITRSCKDVTGNLYATCSRALAADMMSGYPNTVASTGGPNTMVTAELTDSVQDAIRMSAAIESSGQCTALRHCVIPSSVSTDQVQEIFRSVQDIGDAPHALENGMFDGVFANHQGSKSPSKGEYSHDTKSDAYYKVAVSLPDRDQGMEEYWRKVVVDFSMIGMTKEWKESQDDLDALAMWLNTNQPISLAINARYSHMLDMGMYLFERTGVVVYTVGSTNNPDAPPALTCQARPQEAEVFGEFPPRKSLRKYTKFPVVVPSSTPSYDATYNVEYLKSVSISDSIADDVKHLIKTIHDKSIRGYCVELVNYLEDATRENPKFGHGTSRTVLWGLQRPPLLTGLKSCLHCTKNASMDDLAPHLLLFYATNARKQMELSVHPANEKLLHACAKLGLPVLAQKEAEFSHRKKDAYNWKEISGPMESYPMVGNFASLYLPLGHVKSTMLDDEDFLGKFKGSKKWLKMHG